MPDIDARIEPNDGNPYLVVQQAGLFRSYLSLYWHVQPEELERLAAEIRAVCAGSNGRIKEPMPF